MLELKPKTFTVEVGGAEFEFAGLSVDNYIDFFGLDPLKKYDYIKNRLVSVKGVAVDGQEIGLEEFKSAEIDARVFIMIVKGFDQAITDNLKPGDEKNAE